MTRRKSGCKGALDVPMGRQVLATFYAGMAAAQIAGRLGVGSGSVSGFILRACAVRRATSANLGRSFDAVASRAFVVRVRGGQTPVDAGLAMGKSADSALLHARALGLLDGFYDDAPALPVDNMIGRPSEGVSKGEVLVDAFADQAHVNAVMALGGFEVVNFATGWIDGPDGAPRRPIRPAAANTRKAALAA